MNNQMGKLKKTTTATQKENEISPEIFEFIHQFLIGVDNKTLDLRVPHLRQSMKTILPFVISLYVILAVTGILFNLAWIVYSFRKKLYRDPTQCFLLNNALSDIIKCVLVLPISLYVLMINNWMLGDILCPTLPMLQDIPMHTTTLTHLVMVFDRYRYIRRPTSGRLLAPICNVGTWLASICLVLPYPIFIMYIDLGKYFKSPGFVGVGICVVNLANDMKEYTRGIFFIMYVAPVGILAYFCIKTSQELRQQTQQALIAFEARLKKLRSRADSHSTTITEIRGTREEHDCISQNSRLSNRDLENGRADRETYEDDPHIALEKISQKYLFTILSIYVVCIGPLMALRMARLKILETYDNSDILDYVYTIFVWIAYLPVCTTPILIGLWQMDSKKIINKTDITAAVAVPPRSNCQEELELCELNINLQGPSSS